MYSERQYNELLRKYTILNDEYQKVVDEFNAAKETFGKLAQDAMMISDNYFDSTRMCGEYIDLYADTYYKFIMTTYVLSAVASDKGLTEKDLDEYQKEASAYTDKFLENDERAETFRACMEVRKTIDDALIDRK
jgi:hypothetical protein